MSDSEKSKPVSPRGLSIRYKLAIILMVSAVLPVGFGLLSIQYLGDRYYEREQGLVYETTAGYLSVSLEKSIEKEVGQLVEWAHDSRLGPMLAQQAELDPAPPAPQLLARVDEIERKWPSLAAGDPLVKALLHNPVVDLSNAYQQRHPRMVEMLITDNTGRLLAATNKSSDYFQADEAWWQKAMAAPPGEWIIEGIDYDDSAGVYSIDISVAIKAPDGPGNIGVLKGVLDTTSLFRDVRRIVTVEGRHNIIVLPDGRILVNLFEPLIQPLTQRLPPETLERFSPAQESWLLGAAGDSTSALLGVAPLWLEASGPDRERDADARPMWVVVYNDRHTVMAPFRRQVRLLLTGGGLLVAGFSLLGLVLANIKFVRPLSYLRNSAARLTQALTAAESRGKGGVADALSSVTGELDRIDTGDEIEEVADDFRVMAGKLTEYHTSLEAYQGQLENLVEARTRELQIANEDLESFAFIVSHDLKAPLRAISSLSTWLVKDHCDNLNDEGRELLTMMHGRVKRLGDLINGILEYSRASRSEARQDPVNLQEVVPKVVELLEVPAHITLTCADNLPTVLGDETQLGQIFQNLLSNAFKYMDKDRGTVELSCSRAGEGWEFRVKDNGPGIEEKFHERIFKLFQTLNARDDVESTGVGLAVVKKFIENAGGTIRVESTPGAGTSFIFTWPVSDP